MSNSDQQLQDHVNSIAKNITEGFGDELNEDGYPISGYDYLEDVLDINYVINSDRTYTGARILVAFGGPNIWVDTERGIVEGFWWGNYAKASFDDSIGLDDALAELYSC